MKKILFFMGIIFANFNARAGDLLVTGQLSKNVLRYDGVTGAFVDEFVPPSDAFLQQPFGIAYGLDGNLYVLDVNFLQIVRFNGVTGEFLDIFEPNVSGDDLRLGPDGNFYASDILNKQVLRLTTGGDATPFATGVPSPAGLAFGPDENLYVTSSADDSVRRFNGQTGQLIDEFIAPGSGGLNVPLGIAFGPDGNLYVASNASDSVLRYRSSDGSFLDAFVPSGSNGLDGPSGLLFRSDGNLYVSSADSDQILRFDASTGAFVDAFVPAGSGGLDNPYFMTLMPAGELAFSASHVDVNENGGAALIELTRTNGTNGNVTVQFATSDGTALAGINYDSVVQTVTFLEGETAKSVEIPILDNDVVAGNKTVNLSLSNPTDDAVLGTNSLAVLTIQDNDAKGGGGGCQLDGERSMPFQLSWSLWGIPVLVFAMQSRYRDQR